jgi:hypothetical protein
VISRGTAGGMRIGRARFALRAAGTRVVRVRLNRRGQRALARARTPLVKVRYVAGDLRGYATARR